MVVAARKGKCIMKHEWSKSGDRRFAVFLNAKDIRDAFSEYDKYTKKKGRLYASDEYKHPTLKQFVKLFFGVYYDDGWDTVYTVPDRYICTNKNVASKLYSLLMGLQYHDRMDKTYCEVILEGKTINVIYGDY